MPDLAPWTPLGGGSGDAAAQTNLGPGGFRRVQQLPLYNPVALGGVQKQARNPRGSFINGYHYIVTDVYDNTGLGTASVSNLHLLKGTKLTNLVDLGVIVASTAMADVDAGLTCVIPGKITPDGLGGYQMYTPVCDGFYGSLPTKGGNWRWTAPIPEGPWTRDGIAKAIPGTDTSAVSDFPNDNSAPVYWPSFDAANPWIMSVEAYKFPFPAGGRRTEYVKGPTQRGPWTRLALLPTKVGGDVLTNIDAPHLEVDDGTLFLHTTADNYVNQVYEMSPDLVYAREVGIVAQAKPTGVEGGNNSGWGGGSIYRGGGEWWSVWQGVSPTNATCWSVYGGKWIPGELNYIPIQANTYSIVSNQTITGVVDIPIPTSLQLPESVRALDVQIQVTETGVYTAGEALNVDAGYTDSRSIVYPVAANVPIRDRFRIDLLQSKTTRAIRVTPTTPGTMKLSASLLGYWKLPGNGA